MNRHRKATYIMRGEILRQADISKRLKEFIDSEVKDMAGAALSMGEQFEDFLKEVFPIEEKELDKLFDNPPEKFGEALKKQVEKMYKEQEKRFTAEVLRKIERDVYLQILDNFWMQHLENMEHMREGIHWVGVGQKDPLVEYRRQAQAIFEQMQLDLRHDVVRALFHARPVDVSDQPVETELTRAARGSVSNADKIVDSEEFKETDFVSGKTEEQEVRKAHNKRKKARKAERQRKKKGKKKK
jgi:preprotein translocase subunit SecA